MRTRRNWNQIGNPELGFGIQTRQCARSKRANINTFRNAICLVALTFTIGTSSHVSAMDPCGMVPPIYVGDGSAIARTGLQQTYVFYYKGVESFVIRPAFTGKVDNFGMLIPFPNPPAIRKVNDNVFTQIKNAIDPPEVVVDLRPKERFGGGIGGGGGGFGGGGAPPVAMPFDDDRLEVLSEEAVGMYEVAVLSAGSAKALKKWMDQNEYQYPEGMDQVTNDYVNDGWCFVAVKTKVAEKAAADPQPGQRNVQPEMPAGGSFDGAVQALGFRFPTKELVVPMRLSAFNEGDMRNIVYLLTKGRKKIRSIPEEYVVRQLTGKQLVQNLTGPLPMRVLGGGVNDIPQARRRLLKNERNPDRFVAVARALFASDVVASVGFAKSERLNLEHEQQEKELTAISEHFGLRGAEVEAYLQEVVSHDSEHLVESSLKLMRKLTLTVVDGDFPRDVVANDNLRFDKFSMANGMNKPAKYDAKLHGPAPKKDGRLFSAVDPWTSENVSKTQVSQNSNSKPLMAAIGLFGILVLILPAANSFRN